MIKVGVVYGGPSTEYEVSIASAKTIVENLDTTQFQPVPIHIDPQGKWHIYDFYTLNLKSDKYIVKSYNCIPSQLPCDIIFPMIHGKLGEDGALQGFAELLNLPYIGTGILGSAVGINKFFSKQIISSLNIIDVPEYFSIERRNELFNLEDCNKKILKQLHYPIFVKPVNTGSSIGIRYVENYQGLLPALEEAFQYDEIVILEKALQVREIEVAVLENKTSTSKPWVSQPGEVIPSHCFYSYEAKYKDPEGAKFATPAPLLPEQLQQLNQATIQIFNALHVEGMARIDFFLEENTQKLYFNEINTLPGFTTISMYPKLWELSGKTITQLLTDLIELGFARHTRKEQLKKQYIQSVN